MRNICWHTRTHTVRTCWYEHTNTHMSADLFMCHFLLFIQFIVQPTSATGLKNNDHAPPHTHTQSIGTQWNTNICCTGCYCLLLSTYWSTEAVSTHTDTHTQSSGWKGIWTDVNGGHVVEEMMETLRCLVQKQMDSNTHTESTRGDKESFFMHVRQVPYPPPHTHTHFAPHFLFLTTTSTNMISILQCSLCPPHTHTLYLEGCVLYISVHPKQEVDIFQHPK